MRLFLLCCLLGLGLSAGRAGAAADAQAPKVAPAPPRAEGEGPYPQLILRNVTVDQRHRRAGLRPGRHRDRGQPHREGHVGRRARRRSSESRAAETGSGRPRDRPARPLRDARHRRHARPHRRRRAGHAGRIRLQAVARPRHHHDARSGLRQRHRLVRQRTRAQRRATRSRRRASSRTRSSAWAARRRSPRPSRRAPGCAR